VLWHPILTLWVIVVPLFSIHTKLVCPPPAPGSFVFRAFFDCFLGPPCPPFLARFLCGRKPLDPPVVVPFSFLSNLIVFAIVLFFVLNSVQSSAFPLVQGRLTPVSPFALFVFHEFFCPPFRVFFGFQNPPTPTPLPTVVPQP